MKKIISIILCISILFCLLPCFTIAADTSKILAFNDFEIEAVHKASVSINTNFVEIKEVKDQGKVLMFKTPDSGVDSDAFWQPTINNSAFKKIVVSMDIAKDSGTAPIVDIILADVNGKRFQIGRILKNGNVVNNEGTVLTTLEDKDFQNLAFILDFESMTYDIYLNKRKVDNDQPIEKITHEITWIRVYMEKFADGTFYLDNFAMYAGDKIRNISDETALLEKPTPMIGPITPGSGKTYEINYADMTKLDGGVALMVGDDDAYANGGLLKVDVPPVIVNSRTLVPVRFISENFGAQVGWDDSARKVSVKNADKTIELTIDDPDITINGEVSRLDAAATIINDRTMLPLRALVEALGKNVFWDERGLILITDSSKTLDAEIDKRLVTAMYGYLKTGKLALNYAVAPMFNTEIIDEAFAAKDFDFSPIKGNTPNGAVASKALYYLTLLTHLNENAASSDGRYAKDEAIRRLRDLLKGGVEPFACVGPYWSHAVVAADLVLIKNTPAIYNELTDSDKERMDWLMRALAIAGNWGFNDANAYSTGTDLIGNFGKSFNPNYRNTYLNVVISGAMYFGEDELNDIYKSFSYDEYMAKFKELGFTNIYTSWTPAGKEAMEVGGSLTLVDGKNGGSGKGVKMEFKYDKMGLDKIDKIFENLQNYTYGAVCQDKYGSPDGAYYCYIMSGAETPFAGYNGMLLEFASTNRSNAGYCYDSMMIVLPMLANFKLLGDWTSESDAQKNLDSLMYVGNEDLIFKLREGYHGYSSNGGIAKHFDYTYTGSGYRMDLDIWRNFHCMGNEKIVTNSDPNPPTTVLPAPAAEPKDGITSPPDGATIPFSVRSTGTFPSGSAIPLNKSYKKIFTSEFDVVFDNNVTSDFDGVIIHDGSSTAQKPTSFVMANTLIQFNKNRINVRNGSSYYGTKFPVAPNYRYHMRVEINIETKRYSVWITPTYPNSGTEEIAANNVEWRTDAREIDDIGTFIPVVVSKIGSYWIENYTHSGE